MIEIRKKNFTVQVTIVKSQIFIKKNVLSIFLSNDRKNKLNISIESWFHCKNKNI